MKHEAHRTLDKLCQVTFMLVLSHCLFEPVKCSLAAFCNGGGPLCGLTSGYTLMAHSPVDPPRHVMKAQGLQGGSVVHH